jgi:Tfp pilus assembly protein PilF
MAYGAASGLLPGLALALGACASRPAPLITKIVNQQIIVTRAVSPQAYQHLARGLLYQEQARWEEAAEEFEQALNHDRESPEVHARLAELFLHLDRLDDAARHIRGSLSIAETTPGLAAQAHWQQARNDAQGAVATLERAVTSANKAGDPLEAEYAALELSHAALLALDAGHSRHVLESLFERAPSSLRARVRLAALAWALGDVEASERHLQAVIAQDHDQLDTLLSLSWLKVARGQVEEARGHFQDAFDRSERAPEVGAQYARFLTGLGERENAAQVLKDTFKDTSLDTMVGEPDKKSNDIASAKARALSLARQGHVEDAVAHLEEALARRPRHPGLTLALASLEEQRGQWQRALSIAETLLGRDPGNVQALNLWGYVAAEHQHNLSLATRRLVTALAIEPGEPAILDSLGWAFFQSGQLSRAQLFLEQAGRLDPEDPEILTHLGDLYARRSEPTRAAAAFQRALTLNLDQALRDRLTKKLNTLSTSLIKTRVP